MANALITVLDHLDGPNITEEDIHWAAELPTGKGLLDFLASQIQGGDVTSSLRDITLEKEEAKLWHQAIRMKLAITPELPSFTPTQGSELPSASLEYALPSLLRKQLVDIEEEQSLLNRQLSLLDVRIRKTRGIAKAEKQAGKVASTVRNYTARSISDLEVELSELSQMADSAVLSAVQSASQLMGELTIKKIQDGHHAYQSTQEISSLLDDFCAISLNLSMFSSSTQRDSDALWAESHIQTLRSEVPRLTRAIRELEDRHIAASLEEEFERLTEQETRGNSFPSPENDWNDVLGDKLAEVAVSQAWNREQVTRLRRKTQGFKQIANALQDEILPPLALIHATFGMSHLLAEEAHVAMQALADELDDMEVDLRATERSPELVSWPLDNNEALEATKDLLKRLRRLRPTGLPSLVLTERPDVVSELSDVRARNDCANADIPTLCEDVTSDLLSLSSCSQIYLSALTEHSPVPTAQPISLPFQVQQQVINANAQLAEVSHALEEMHLKHQTDGRVNRKLDIFVEAHSR